MCMSGCPEASVSYVWPGVLRPGSSYNIYVILTRCLFTCSYHTHNVLVNTYNRE